jgi:restriction system protein
MTASREDTKASLPKVAALSGAIKKALEELGGEGALKEIAEKVIRILDITPEQAAVPHASGKPRTELDYRMAWARSKMKQSGELRRVGRGIWALQGDSR